MKSCIPLSAIGALATIFTLTTANFDVYFAASPPRDKGRKLFREGYKIFDSDPPDCAPVYDSYFYSLSKDVADDRIGVRCSGEGRKGSHGAACTVDVSISYNPHCKQAG
jgi:hypothetical protein